MGKTLISLGVIYILILAILSITNILAADSIFPINGGGIKVDENNIPVDGAPEEEPQNNDGNPNDSQEEPTENEGEAQIPDVQNPNQSALNSILILVNKTNSLPSTYTPKDLTVPDVRFSFEGPHEKQSLRKEAATALEALFTGAQEEGIILFAVSGYRSYNRQDAIYTSNVQRLGQVETDKISAKPGHSEHQTGLAMDISSHSAGFSLSEAFGSTMEGKWVAENAHKYGFIVRYPKGKESITGYSYEPWHIRYVGVTVAGEIFEKNLTLEEYLGN